MLWTGCWERLINNLKISNLIQEFQELYLQNNDKYRYIEGADEKLDSAKILDMLSISDDGSVSIDDAKVTKYVQQLASKYNTFGRKRSFKTSSGDTIEIGGGDYGWVVSKKNEKAQLLSDLEGGKPVEREPVYEQTALHRGADDIGNTYRLTTQSSTCGITRMVLSRWSLISCQVISPVRMAL